MQTLAFIQNLGAGEWIGILAVLILLFGAKKLPDLATSMGKSIKNFKRGIDDGKDDEDPPQIAPQAQAEQDVVPSQPVSSRTHDRP